MALSAYDSPTFLGRKDRFLLGMSLSQLGIAAVVCAFWWFFIDGVTDLSVVPRAIVFVPCQAASLAILFVRVSGLSIPVYTLMFVKQRLKNPVYESDRSCAINGPPDAVVERDAFGDVTQPTLLQRLLPFGRKRFAVAAEQRYEMQAEGEEAMEQGLRQGQQFVKDGVKALWRGA